MALNIISLTHFGVSHFRNNILQQTQNKFSPCFIIKISNEIIFHIYIFRTITNIYERFLKHNMNIYNDLHIKMDIYHIFKLVKNIDRPIF